MVNASGGLPWSLEAAEDSEAAVELEAVLSLAEDPATAEQLPDFQQGFASLIAHYGAPLLDGNIISYDGMIYMMVSVYQEHSSLLYIFC